MTSPILSVSNLSTSFRVGEQWKSVVRDISFDIMPKETLAVVGEPGSGKRVTALSIMRLNAPASSRIEGSIRLDGKDLLTLPDQDMRLIRGNEVVMIFQEPMTSPNPALTVDFQIAEALILHRHLSRSEAEAETIRLLEKGPHPGGEIALSRISAPFFGRHAPVRDDCHAAGLQAQAAGRRRADHRA